MVAGGIYAAVEETKPQLREPRAGAGRLGGLSASGGQLPEKLDDAECSWDLFRTLGVQPALGRDFTAADDSPSANGTVMLSWGLWKRRFGSDPAIVDKAIYLNATSLHRDRRDARLVRVSRLDHTNLDAGLPQQAAEDRWPHSTSTCFAWWAGSKPGVTRPQGNGRTEHDLMRIHNAHLNDPFIFKGANSRPLLEHMVGDIKEAALHAAGGDLLPASDRLPQRGQPAGSARGGAAQGAGHSHRHGRRMDAPDARAADGEPAAFGRRRRAGTPACYGRARLADAHSPDISRVESIHIDGVVAAFTVGVDRCCALCFPD